MDFEARYEQLRLAWTDKFVEVHPGRPELARFKGIVGRVVTVNCNGKAIVDFQDGGWYDIAADERCLTFVTDAAAVAKYKNSNSAQVVPDKQG